MGHIFYLMGKSASGKDAIYEELMAKKELNLKPLILYTTRPIRARETDGVEYHFTDEEQLQRFLAAGTVIELRAYHTVHGIWKYFTVADEQTNPDLQDFLAIGVPESFCRMKAYYGEEKVIPLYIEVEDGIRLERALRRERKQAQPKYEEMCRRFLADQADFSEEKLEEAGIRRRFSNDGDREACIGQVEVVIREYQKNA